MCTNTIHSDGLLLFITLSNNCGQFSKCIKNIFIFLILNGHFISHFYLYNCSYEFLTFHAILLVMNFQLVRNIINFIQYIVKLD